MLEQPLHKELSYAYRTLIRPILRIRYGGPSATGMGRRSRVSATAYHLTVSDYFGHISFELVCRLVVSNLTDVAAAVVACNA